MDPAPPTTTEPAWRHWHEQCAIGKCSPHHAATLQQFGRSRFITYINRYASRIGHTGSDLHHADADHAWHLFETYCQLSTSRNGKHYKDWLLQRAEDPGATSWIEAVESGASLLLRDAVRELLRNEHSAAFMTSLHRSVGGNPDTPYSLEELIPDTDDPADRVAEQELSNLAADIAHTCFPRFERRHRIALWARINEIPLSDPRLHKKTRCSKTMLYAAYQESVHLVFAEIHRKLPGEPPNIFSATATFALSHAAKMIEANFFSEKSNARFLRSMNLKQTNTP